MKCSPCASTPLILFIAATVASSFGVETEPSLAAQFQQPPPSARPWVYWFWNNGNVTEEGIDADLSAMKEVGIGGAIVMDVLERFAPPAGDADYMSTKWQRLMVHALEEARKLGIELNVTNGPGWCGSSGPWITPELSMQTLVSSVTEVSGSDPVILPMPALPEIPTDVFSSKVESKPFYRDVAVLAFPKSDGPVSPDEVLDVTKSMSESGRLNHKLPRGEWIVQRVGHTSTGASTRPPVKGGNGLEADKFNAEAIALHFNKVIGMLAEKAPRSTDGGLAATHVDSWEVGNQNWTTDFAGEFKKRRGYDLTKYLPNVAFPLPHAHIGGSAIPTDPPEHPIGSPEEVERFQWDFYQTCSELLSEKYIGTLVKLSHENGLRFTMEGYNLPFGNEAEYTAPADEPMTEFWSTGGLENARKAHEMASVAHTMGRNVVGAEAFTANEADKWNLHPALIKSMGDYQFAQGVNRFVIHRYAMQPYMDRFPGATMGPWGLHYERTNTWWPMSGAWHEYLARCQFMLRQGLFVADALYLRHQRPNQTYFDQNPPLPPGYRADDISAEQLIARAAVQDGRIVLPDGMSYALLVVPESPMTPALVRKIGELIEQGATVYGPRPTKSPSLTDYPACDETVDELSEKIWGSCDGKRVTEHAFGKGRVINGTPLASILADLTGGPDFQSSIHLGWIHRATGERDIYFIANPHGRPVIAEVDFRITGKVPQWWDPETGETRRFAQFRVTSQGTKAELALDQNQSGFIVFEPTQIDRDQIVAISRNGEQIVKELGTPEVHVESASYGPHGDAKHTIDAKPLIEAQLRQGNFAFPVSRLAESNDPALGVLKTLQVKATVDGKPFEWQGIDTDHLDLLKSVALPKSRTTVWGADDTDTFIMSSGEGGEFLLESSSGKDARVSLPRAREIELPGPWTVTFPPGWGAPAEIKMEKLESLSKSSIEGVRHFSGISAYQTTFDFPATDAGAPGRERLWLNLGELEVMADVKLNGHDLGTVWNRPSRIEITGAVKSGENELVVKVANTWQNRMIGDAALPESKRYTWSSYEPFTADTSLPKSGLIGPVTIESTREVEVKFE